MTGAVFLDRDGVIIENRSNYVRSWADVAFIPGALKALERLAAAPFKIIVVTNQSPVGRGIITLEEAESINQRFLTVIKNAGGRIDGVYMCPHAPQDNCQCRKPLPGLLLDAARDLEIELENSLMVGDALTDMRAGQQAGVPDNYLVLTGRGKDQLKLPGAEAARPFTVIDSLANLPAIAEHKSK